ncbi:flotillin family protein [soil metagenome]
MTNQLILLAQDGSVTGAIQVIAAVVVAIVGLLITLGFIAHRWHKSGPNEVLVISGGRGTESGGGPRLVRGGGTFVMPFKYRVDHLSLEIMTINVQTPEVYTAAGVTVIVDGIAQVKIDNTEEAIRTAAEQFLAKSPMEIQNVALETLEGHLRAVLGTLSVEEIYKEREKFASRVQEYATSDMANMGLRIVSFVIKNITDRNGYLDALGKPRTAQVKRDAIIGQAEADRDATIRSAEANRSAQIAKLAADTNVAEADRDYRMSLQEYQAGVNQKKAEAELAYDIQRNTTMQISKTEEMKIQVVEREGLINVQVAEINRRERELDATVRKPAEAERYRVEMLAEAQRVKFEKEASGAAQAERSKGTAEADVKRAIGLAEAEVIKAKGLAEAESIKARGLASAEVIRAEGLAQAEANRKKAESWQYYNQAAIAELLINALPLIAREVAAPLGKTDKITIISNGGAAGDGTGASKITSDVTSIIAGLPPIVEGLTGVKLAELLKGLPTVKEEYRQVKKSGDGE